MPMRRVVVSGVRTVHETRPSSPAVSLRRTLRNSLYDGARPGAASSQRRASGEVRTVTVEGSPNRTCDGATEMSSGRHPSSYGALGDGLGEIVAVEVSPSATAGAAPARARPRAMARIGAGFTTARTLC